MDTQTASTSDAVARCSDAEFGHYVQRFSDRFRTNAAHHGALFATDAHDLYDVYLAALPAADRQYHACHACAAFFRTYGGLATIDAQGRVESAIWHAADAPAYYAPVVRALAARVARAAVTGPFLGSSQTWGTFATGAWHHFALRALPRDVHTGATTTAHQAMAAKREDFKTVARALEEYSPETLAQAVTLLRAEALYRGEHVLGQAEWLATLHADLAKATGAARDNLLWRAIARAPAGFCHPRASMIGTLLDDLAAGLDVATVAARFAEKMHPASYQRPQAPPRAGAIAQAEKIFEQLAAAGALERRYARLEDVRETAWTPRAARASAPKPGALFAHLQPRAPEAAKTTLRVPPKRITWTRFAEVVMPTAEKIECFVEPTMSFVTLMTGANPDAPPIFQWGHPVSWYFWIGGSPATQYGLTPGAYHPVAAITYKPSMWGDRSLEHHGDAVFLILEGARETRRGGGGIFPECLRSEFHGIRSVLEAYSRTAQPSGIEAASASGVGLSRGQDWNCRVRVTSGATQYEYVLDRWE